MRWALWVGVAWYGAGLIGFVALAAWENVDKRRPVKTKRRASEARALLLPARLDPAATSGEPAPMRLIIHDFAGHPFQAQLSRALAARGHIVQHVQCADYISGKGRLEREPDDPSSLDFVALTMNRTFNKYSVITRVQQEVAYGRLFLRQVKSFAPDCVVMCNVPLFAHAAIDARLHRAGVPTVFWHQDVYSDAIGSHARQRLGAPGAPIAWAADKIERRIADRSGAIIAISDSFLDVYQRWALPTSKIVVIPNWQPIDEVVPHQRDNTWALENGLVGIPTLLYSGTLGVKHDPQQLVDLLRGVRTQLPDTRLIVVSEGVSAESLKLMNEPGLTVLPFQPFDRLSEVLASGDVLVTILESGASNYSVPSKTLTYLCSGRPVVALMPRTNAGYHVVVESGGLAMDLADVDIRDASSAVASLLEDEAGLLARGEQARNYAVRSFDIQRLSLQFERIIGAVASGHSDMEDSDGSEGPVAGRAAPIAELPAQA
jgi:colanic acid biosynthesis glycosyl transferase WcaI